jgi:branched-chain amino acid aminotransferase
MVGTDKIKIEKVRESRLHGINFKELMFGRTFTDHMFVADFRGGTWQNLRIAPYGHMQISPASPAIHYGQTIFEGLKAHRGQNDEVLVFRPIDNWKRMNISAERMALATLPEEVFMDGLITLLDVDREWVPRDESSSLYLRPFLFSADEYIGIRPSVDFTFMIVASPSGAYYSQPLRVKIETKYTRAVEGGTGFAKAAGNYAGAIFPSKIAQEKGYHQLIWTDGKRHEYIEESGTMNLMFVIEDTLVTPALSDSILAGITRDSVLTIARHWGMKVEERKISVNELVKGLQNGIVKEAFGVGTAATIARIEVIGHDGNDYNLPPVTNSGFSNRVYVELDKIKRGKKEDVFNWVLKI